MAGNPPEIVAVQFATVRGISAVELDDDEDEELEEEELDDELELDEELEELDDELELDDEEAGGSE